MRLRAVWCGVAGLTLVALTLFAGTPAYADCNPAATSGGTVTCTTAGGTQTTSVGTGAEDNVIVNIQPGATVDLSGSPGATGIDLHDGNTVTNQGTVRVGDGSLGISVNNSNTVNNAGSIIFGDGSTGINGCCDNTIVNSGSITGGTSGYGIFVTDHSTITNSGTITVGSGSYGILGYGDGAGATITNSGTITAPGGYGIGAITGYNIINSGTINFGNNGYGIQVDGGNTVTNSGTIRGAGNSGAGIYLDAFGYVAPGNTVLNAGSILVTDGYALVGDSDNTITNTGTLQGRIFLAGTGNTLTNRGYIIGGDANSFASPSGGTIGGTLINDPAGTLAIRVAPTFNDYYLADTVTLNGGRLHIVVTAGLYGTTTVYSSATTGAAPVMTCGCGSLTGTFDTVTSSSPFFSATADYSTPGEVDVTLTRYGFGSVPGMTSNQRAVGGALEQSYSPSLDPTSTAGQFYANLFAVNSLTVLDQLSGAGTTSAQDASFGAGGQFTNAMFQQGLAWLTGAGGGNSITVGAPLGYAAAPKNRAENRMAGHDAFAAMPLKAAAPGRWRAWGLGFGATRSVNGDGNTLGTADQTTRTVGGAFGVDHQLANDLLLGLAVGGSGSTFSVSSLSTSGRVDGGHVGVYAVKTFGKAYIAGTLNYARFDNSTERTIAGVGTTETANGRFNSDLFGGRLELGWRTGFDRYTVTPFAAIEPTALRQQAYTESATTTTGGNGVLGLSYASRTTTSLPLFLGAQIDTRYVLGGGQVLTPSARLSWVHEFKPERQIEASFASLPAGSFTVDGARAARDAARIDISATLALNQSMALFASFNGEFSGISSMVAGTAGAKIAW